MEAAAGFLTQECKSLTERSTFVITASDVGTLAVRHGVAEQLEQERQALLIAGRLVLKRIREHDINIGAAYEAILESAVRMTEASL